MIAQSASDLVAKALSYLPYKPLATQESLICAMADFVVNSAPRDVFVLNGYAGTGKTSLAGGFIKAFVALKGKPVILAPTGRAAKVASEFAARQASTIHRRLFRPIASEGGATSYFIAPNDSKDTLFIVDEASLVNDSGSGDSLLALLVNYVYSAPGCRLMLIGDSAQLPPVGQSASTAMSPDRLRALGLNPVSFTLDVPVRQAAGSGIVHNATLVRGYQSNTPPDGPELHLSGFPEMKAVSSAELADCLSDSYGSVGMDETLIITRSNSRANKFNLAVRNMVMFAEEPLERGERIVISKNDYYWGKRSKGASLIANGESATVNWVGRSQKVYGRFFTEVELTLSDGSIITANLMLRSLVCDGPAIPRQEMERLYNHVLAAYEGEISEKIRGALDDPFYNALQAKYAYCVTCHKAQGGQWKHVYIDMGGINPDAFGPDFYRWLYTALTRATEKVFLINPGLRIK
ncbi:MAG: AAA family ATPase [Candidatus Amulumruptor caecigallinarius]|nr:AAA family ATPase [Candidatus Amulumruptor caecigallinarius]